MKFKTKKYLIEEGEQRFFLEGLEGQFSLSLSLSGCDTFLEDKKNLYKIQHRKLNSQSRIYRG